MKTKILSFIVAIAILISPNLNADQTLSYGITVAWDANPASEMVKGYKILYGTESGKWTNVIDVGNVLQVTVLNLTNNTQYYFIAKAYADGNESPPSVEIKPKATKLYSIDFTSDVFNIIKTNSSGLVYSTSFLFIVTWYTNLNSNILNYKVVYGKTSENLTNEIFVPSYKDRLGLLGSSRSSNYFFNVSSVYTNKLEQISVLPFTILIPDSLSIDYTNYNINNKWRPISPFMLKIY